MFDPPETDSTPEGDRSLRWCARLLHHFWKQGVRRVILSPGSRSTPLVLATNAHPGLESSVVLDERSAAFQALGEAKITGRPTLLVCTSGSALANYLPAVIEADMAGIPLLMLTADRPPHLRGTGSSQTLDQLHFFGPHTRFFHELGEPREDPESVRRLARLAEQAVSISMNPGGVVHLNLPFRKPLEPKPVTLQTVASELETLMNKERQGRETLPHPWVEQPAVPMPDPLVEAISRARRPILIAGTDTRHRHLGAWILQLQTITGMPVLAEPGAPVPDPVHTVTRFEPLLQRLMDRGPAPDLILRTGHTTFSKRIQQFESWLDGQPDLPVWHLHTREGWQHGAARIDHRITVASPLKITPKQSAHLVSEKTREDQKTWARWWEEQNREQEKQLVHRLTTDDTLTDPVAIRHVCTSIPQDGLLMVSNSMTIRDLLRVRPRGCRVGNVVTQRGAAGIDGILSTAIGMARVSAAPVTLLIGDLAALHDSGALLSLAGTEIPLRIVVLENGGGTIFRMLPVASMDPAAFRTCFETPQPTRISALSRAHELTTRTARTIDELTRHLEAPVTGPELLECITDPDASMEFRTNL